MQDFFEDTDPLSDAQIEFQRVETILLVYFWQELRTEMHSRQWSEEQGFRYILAAGLAALRNQRKSETLTRDESVLRTAIQQLHNEQVILYGRYAEVRHSASELKLTATNLEMQLKALVSLGRASSLDRLLKCIGGEVLGGVDTRSAGVMEAGAWGTMVHGWKETGEIKAPKGYAKLEPLFKRKLEKTKVRREQWWPADTVHEAALSVEPNDFYAMKVEGTREEKEEWKASVLRAITGTCDGYWWMFDTLYVDDLKTGREVTLEQYEGQLLFYALGVARTLAYSGPVHVTLTHWPRYPVTSLPRRFGRVVEQEELKAFENRLAKLGDDISRARDGVLKKY